MKFNRRRGVSPVIEALLVTAIALGAGGLFYGFYSGLLGTTSQQAAVTIQQLSLSVGTNGAVFSITLKNGGNVPFASTALKVVMSGLPAVGTTTAPAVTSAGSNAWTATTPVATDTAFTFSVPSGSLSIGLTTGFTASFSAPSLTVGNNYPVSIVVGSVTLSTVAQAVTG